MQTPAPAPLRDTSSAPVTQLNLQWKNCVHWSKRQNIFKHTCSEFLFVLTSCFACTPRCNGKKECTLTATTEHFGKPVNCDDNPLYLAVDFLCLSTVGATEGIGSCAHVTLLSLRMCSHHSYRTFTLHDVNVSQRGAAALHYRCHPILWLSQILHEKQSENSN